MANGHVRRLDVRPQRLVQFPVELKVLSFESDEPKTRWLRLQAEGI